MKTYTLKKSELLKFYEQQTKNLNTFPNEYASIRIPKNEVEKFVETGKNEGNWHELVPANRNNQKIFKVTQEQFQVLLLGLLAQKLSNSAEK
jgi:hypothetical protein